MDGKTLARIAAIIFVAVAITATALEMTRKEDRASSGILEAPAASASNAPREGLRRCQRLGEAALGDDDCLRMWAEQRDRFLKSKTPFADPAAAPVTPWSPTPATPEAR